MGSFQETSTKHAKHTVTQDKCSRNRAQKEGQTRRRKVCPKCHQEKRDLKRHITSVHNTSADEAEKIMNRPKCQPENRRIEKICCQPGCGKIIKRPLYHLMSKAHGLSPKDAAALVPLCKKVGDKTELSNKMTNPEQIAKEFIKWYSSMAGGFPSTGDIPKHKQNEKTALLNKIEKQIALLVRLQCGDNFNRSSLSEFRYFGGGFDDPIKENKDCPVHKLKQGRTWGTVKCYITALGHFIRFIEASPELHPWAFQNESYSLRLIKLTTAGCAKSVTRLAKIEENKRVVQKDVASIIAPETLADFIQSE